MSEIRVMEIEGNPSGIRSASTASQSAGTRRLVGGENHLRDTRGLRHGSQAPGRGDSNLRDQPLGRRRAAAAMQDNQRRTVRDHGFMVAAMPVSCICAAEPEE